MKHIPVRSFNHVSDSTRFLISNQLWMPTRLLVNAQERLTFISTNSLYAIATAQVREAFKKKMALTPPPKCDEKPSTFFWSKWPFQEVKIFYLNHAIFVNLYNL